MFFFSINDSIQQWLEMVLACFFPALALPSTLLFAWKYKLVLAFSLICTPCHNGLLLSSVDHCEIELSAGNVQPRPCVKSVGVWGHTWFGHYDRPPSSQCDSTMTTAEYPLTSFC